MDDIQESNAESQQGRQNGAHWTTNLKKTILVLSLYSAYEQLTADNYTYITNILNIMQLFQRTTIARYHQQYTVIDWVRGQQQFCLTRERICCPKPQAEGNRSVRGSNKTAVVRGASL